MKRSCVLRLCTGIPRQKTSTHATRKLDFEQRRLSYSGKGCCYSGPAITAIAGGGQLRSESENLYRSCALAQARRWTSCWACCRPSACPVSPLWAPPLCRPLRWRCAAPPPPPPLPQAAAPLPMPATMLFRPLVWPGSGMPACERRSRPPTSPGHGCDAGQLASQSSFEQPSASKWRSELAWLIRPKLHC